MSAMDEAGPLTAPMNHGDSHDEPLAVEPPMAPPLNRVCAELVGTAALVAVVVGSGIRPPRADHE
ncbi:MULTISPECIES: hypothetical protein [unclassified Streptomyces]|uniref:hypothetical protein n=1 Tax=unclassified Streptomyces TaxID=2593676 RepID=UPI003322DFA0